MYILGYDSENSYTERLETHIYVFWSPCVHGICSPKFNDSPPCDDVSRATSFDLFKCSCFSGYTGEWCENEIDECLQQPCGELYNCIDKVNSYECEVKIWFPILIIMLVVILIAIITACIICIPKPTEDDATKDKKMSYHEKSQMRLTCHS